MQNIKFSVIIPIYKVEEYLDECVQSVLCQQYPDFEVILVDDGSPDKCPAMCDAYAAADSRVKVIHKLNGGLSDARNAGLEVANGDFIAFLDSDDYWNDPLALQKAADIIATDPETDVVIFQVIKLKNGERKYPEIHYDVDEINNKQIGDTLNILVSFDQFRPSAWNKFIRRKVLTENNIKFTKGLVSEDFDWSFSLFAHVKKVKILEDFIYTYRIRSGSITHSLSDKNLNDIFWIIRKWDILLCQKYSDQKVLEVQLNQLGFMYAMLISITHFSSNPKEFLKRLKPYKYLLEYDKNPKVKKAKNAINILGFYPTYLLMSWRNRINRKI